MPWIGLSPVEDLRPLSYGQEDRRVCRRLHRMKYNRSQKIKEDPEWHWRDPDGEVTTHISFRLFSPHYESESLDLGMAFPLDGERVLEFVQESARVIDKPWLNVAIFSQPQLHDDYGSVILVPEWLGASEKEVLLVDASGVGHGIFAHYQSGPISRYSMLRLIEYEGPDEAEVYAFGAREPLIENEPVPPVPGGLVKIIVKGDPLHWATPIADRLQAPDMWRPDTEHCGHLEGPLGLPDGRRSIPAPGKQGAGLHPPPTCLPNIRLRCGEHLAPDPDRPPGAPLLAR